MSEVKDSEVLVKRFFAERAGGKGPGSAKAKTEWEKEVPEDSLYSFLKEHGVSDPAVNTANLIIPTLKFNKEDQKRIPKDTPNVALTEDIALVTYYTVFHGMSSLLYGPPGTGKTTVPKWLCQQWGLPCTVLEFMPGTEPEYHLGQMTFNEKGAPDFRLGDVPEALSKPGLVILDEMLKADPYVATCVLQSALDGRRSVAVPNHPDASMRRIKLHDQTSVMLTSNTSGSGRGQHQYVERSHDKSTLNRVNISAEVGYMSKTKESRFLQDEFKLDKEPADVIVNVATMARKAMETTHMSLWFTYRSSITAAKLFLVNGDLRSSLWLAYGNGLEPDEKNTFNNWLDSVI